MKKMLFTSCLALALLASACGDANSGGKLLVAFVSLSYFGRHGSWGNKEEYPQQDNAPKARAVIDFQSQNPCWWNNCARQ